MTPLYDRITEAWRSGGPPALHRAAEQLAAQGHEESAIYDALERLLLEERAAGADDETEDRITDVMDRLTGWCHVSNHIKTRRGTLPTEEEIAALPRWARVAFAARCARRALPVFRLRWPDAPAHYDSKLYAAVELSELSAALGGQSGDVVDYARASTLAAYVIDAAINAARDRKRATTVVDATIAVFSRLKDVPIQPFDRAVLTAVHNTPIAIADGIATGPDTYNAASLIAETMIRRDYDHLARLARQQAWTDDTPVPSAVFGPLWPEGSPPGWPADPSGSVDAGQPPDPLPREGTMPAVLGDEVGRRG